MGSGKGKNRRAQSQTTTWIRRASHDFDDDKGETPAHPHTNPDGSEGGWVADTAQVAPTAYVDRKARVYGNAEIGDGAAIGGGVIICGSAKVVDNTRIATGVYNHGEITPAAAAAGSAGLALDNLEPVAF